MKDIDFILSQLTLYMTAEWRRRTSCCDEGDDLLDAVKVSSIKRKQSPKNLLITWTEKERKRKKPLKNMYMPYDKVKHHCLISKGDIYSSLMANMFYIVEELGDIFSKSKSQRWCVVM